MSPLTKISIPDESSERFMVYFPFCLFEGIYLPGLWILPFISHNYLAVGTNRWETYWCPLVSIRRNGRWWIPQKLSLKRESTIGNYWTWIISPFPWMNYPFFLGNLWKQNTNHIFLQKSVYYGTLKHVKNPV